jgi:hypothetical protein
MTPWIKNFIQFPRLLAEIQAVGLTAKQRREIGESMDLEGHELDDLFERASQQWELIKQGVKPHKKDTARAKRLRDHGDIKTIPADY